MRLHKISFLLFFLFFSSISTPFAETKFLYIGISKFLNKDLPHLSSLDIEKDNFKELVTKKYSFTDKQAKFLLDTSATKANITHHLKTYFKKSDSVIIYFSGHVWKYKKDGYMLTYDTIRDVPGTFLKISSLLKLIYQNSEATNVTIFFDTCYSSILIDQFHEIQKEIDKKDKKNKKFNLFTSSSKNNYTYQLPFYKQTYFGYMVISGLYDQADQNKDKKITFQELQKFLEQSVKDVHPAVLHIINMFQKDPKEIIQQPYFLIQTPNKKIF